MEKTKSGIKKMLKEQYEKGCNGYLCELLRMWGLSACYGYWNSDQPGTIYHYGDTHNLTMEDIIYIVENDIEEDEVLAWEDYALDAYEFGFLVPNLKSWHRGCPRTPPEVFEKLIQMKADLDKAVEEEKARMKKADEGKEALLNQKLEDQDLTVRTLLSLKKLGCETIRDLVELSPSKRKELGKKVTSELTDFMADMGLTWQG